MRYVFVLAYFVVGINLVNWIVVESVHTGATCKSQETKKACFYFFCIVLHYIGYTNIIPVIIINYNSLSFSTEEK